MNIFDIITLIFALLAVVNGWRKGFITQLCSLIGILGGVALAVAFGAKVGALFGIDPTFSKPIGFMVTFVVSTIATSFIAKILSSIFSSIGLGGLDSLLGIALSALKYGLILSVLFVAFENLNKEVHLIKPHIISESKCFKPISALSDTALSWFNTFTKEVQQ